MLVIQPLLFKAEVQISCLVQKSRATDHVFFLHLLLFRHPQNYTNIEMNDCGQMAADF